MYSKFRAIDSSGVDKIGCSGLLGKVVSDIRVGGVLEVVPDVEGGIRIRSPPAVFNPGIELPLLLLSSPVAAIFTAWVCSLRSLSKVSRWFLSSSRRRSRLASPRLVLPVVPKPSKGLAELRGEIMDVWVVRTVVVVNPDWWCVGVAVVVEEKREKLGRKAAVVAGLSERPEAAARVGVDDEWCGLMTKWRV